MVFRKIKYISDSDRPYIRAYNESGDIEGYMICADHVMELRQAHPRWKLTYSTDGMYSVTPIDDVIVWSEDEDEEDDTNKCNMCAIL